jgi:hypothetical protein
MKGGRRPTRSISVSRLLSPVLAAAALAAFRIHSSEHSGRRFGYDARRGDSQGLAAAKDQGGRNRTVVLDRHDGDRNQTRPSPTATDPTARSAGNTTATASPLVDAVAAAVAAAAARGDERNATEEAAASSSSSVFYSVARTDRSGASIRDMVAALAYGRAAGLEYGGACYVRPMSVNAPRRQAEKLALIGSLGLQGVLRFACPEDFTGRQMVLPSRYMNNRTQLLTPEFAEWLRSRRRAAPDDSSSNTNEGAALLSGAEAAVVHVRRGDVDPCQLRDRYLPSSYYVEVLDKYVPASVPVTVFSESSSFEPWDDFARQMGRATPSRNWTLRLDTPPPEVWQAVASARYLVVSLSSFAYVPSLVNAWGGNATVVYAPTWQFVPMPTWTSADRAIRVRAREEVARLAAERCPNYTSVTPGRSSWNESRRR